MFIFVPYLPARLFTSVYIGTYSIDVYLIEGEYPCTSSGSYQAMAIDKVFRRDLVLKTIVKNN